MFPWIDAVYRWCQAVARIMKRIVTQPAHELNRWQSAVRFAYDLGRFGARQLRHDRAEEMAAALAFRTLFGLLPVLVVALVLVKAFGMTEYFMEPLDAQLHFWGVDNVQIIPPPGVEGATTSLAQWVRERVREAEKVNLAAIGWIGLGVTVYAAISLLATIENSFNVIYRAPQGRSWAKRIPLYWFMLTVSPVAIVASHFVSGYFEDLMTFLEAQPWIGTTVAVLWSMVAFWLLMFAAYALFPNTRVSLRSAGVGALVAAVLLEIGKRTMGIYLQNALSISQLYGSLGLIPLFMFWVYLMWLAMLFGLQVSSTLQHLHGRKIAELKERRAESLVIDPGVVVVVMQWIAQQFQAGRPSRVSEIANAASLPETVIENILTDLAEAGYLYRLADDEESFTLSRPPSEVSVRRLLEIAFDAADRGESPGEQRRGVLLGLREAQINSVADGNLAAYITAG